MNFNGKVSDEVIDYIAVNSDDRQLSLRLLTPSLRKLLYARSEGIDWRPMVKSQLHSLGRKNNVTKRLDNKTKDLKTLRIVLKKFPDAVKDQQENWCRMTGKSRASFYRSLARLRNDSDV